MNTKKISSLNILLTFLRKHKFRFFTPLIIVLEYLMAEVTYFLVNPFKRPKLIIKVQATRECFELVIIIHPLV